MRLNLLIPIFSFLIISVVGKAQTQVFSTPGNDLQIAVSAVNECSGSGDGYFIFNVQASPSNEDGELNFLLNSNPTIIAASIALPFNTDVIVPAAQNLSTDTYTFLASSPNASASIFQPIALNDATPVTITPNSIDLSNDDVTCSVLDAEIIVDLSDGSLPLGGFLNYAITTDNAISGVSGDTQSLGSTQLDFRALLNPVDGLPGGTYTLTVSDPFSTCADVIQAYTVTDPAPASFNISTPTASVCEGDDITITVDASEENVVYEIYVDGSPTGITSTGPGAPNVGDPVNIVIPSAFGYTASDDITVLATLGLCTSVFMNNTLNVNFIPVPDINNPGPQSGCDTFTLPAITGSNLSGNEAYYTATGGGGTQLNAGDAVTTTQTLFIYDETGTTPNCFDEESFLVTINTTPILDPVTDVTVCDSYTLPVITGTNLTGNEAYYTATGGGGTQLNAGDAVTTTQTLFIYDETGTAPNCFDETSFDVTIIPSPVINNPGNQEACDTFTLPVITGSNLSGNEAYYTATGGGGTQLNPGDPITANTTLFIYDETGTVPNCFDEETFTVTINTTPDVDPVADVIVCDSYSLPAITGTNLTGNEAYYTATGGGGTQLNPGDAVSTTQTLFIYDETGTTPNCFDEESFTVTISTTPDVDPVADVTACDTFTLPAITGTNLTGNEAYFTATGGGGTQLNPGDAVTTTQTLFIYDETGTTPNCFDEESFTITINLSPDVDPLANTEACDSFTLPAITGTNLTGNEAYYTATGGGGTQLNPGDAVTTTQTLFIYDETGTTPNCFDEESFTVTINVTPDVDPVADITVCDAFTLPAITGTNLSGNEAYYTAAGGGGTQLNPGDAVTATQTLFIYDETGTTPNCFDEESFTVTVNLTPDVDPVADVEACDSFVLPAISGTNLTGNEAYYTATGGGGTQLNPGDAVTTSQTLFIYDETGTVPNCFDEESFTITINVTPDVDPIADVTVCDSFILPVITGTNLSGNEAYYTATGGTGTQLNAGDVVTSTQTLFIYDETGSTPNCFDEEIFTVTVNLTPDIDAVADVEACDSFTLPAITGTNLTGNEAYYTATGGGGTQLNPGDAVTTTQTLFIFDETGTTPNCFDEESFSITINLSPVITNPGDQEACDSFTLPAIVGTNLSGNEAYYTATGGTGSQLNAGDVVTSTQTLFIYDETGTTPNCTNEVSFIVTINLTPDVDAQPDAAACDFFTLPAITGTNLTGNEAYYTGTGGTGTQFNAGDNVTVSGVYFIYDETSTTPNCFDEESFNVLIQTTPNADAGPDQDVCFDNALLNAVPAGADQTGTWTILSGNGTFTDPNDPNTTVSGVGSGLNIYRWTVTDDLGLCPSDFDDVAIDFLGVSTLADAGTDQIVCTDNATLAANVVAAGETGVWTVITGTGTFSNPNDPAATVTGMTEGINEFQWEITDNTGTCPPNGDVVQITFIDVTVADAGPDAAICVDTYFLAANPAGVGETGTWTVVSGAGTFTNANDPNTTVTALGAGVNEFQWTISDDTGNCPSSSDNIIVDVFGTSTLANAGPDQSACVDNATLAANSVAAGETGTWSVITGTGTFSDVNDPAAIVSGLSVGINEFQWEISDNSGTCPPNGDIVAINFIDVTIADAGSDASVCIDSYNLMANAPGANETGTWSVVSGAGTFADNNDPNTAVSGLAAGVNVFIWEISDNTGICPATSDLISIDFFGSLTAADAGPDQTICLDNTTLAANAAGGGETGTWTVIAGTGTFSDPNDPNATVSGLSSGLNEFQWEISDNAGTCPPNGDIVSIEFINVTIADAGSDDAICVDFYTLGANAPAASETGTWTVISGSGVFADANDPNSSVSGLSAGINEFQWEITDNTGTCTATNAIVSIDVFGSSTVADAGTDQTTCSEVTVLAANSVVAGETGTWTVITGTGTFSDVNDPSASVSGLSSGLNEFQWTVSDDTGTCPPNGDIVAITFNSVTVANAGSDAISCSGTEILTATPLVAGETGTWTVISGSGTFTNANNPSSTVTGLTSGPNVYRWTVVDDSGACPDTFDDVIITFDPSDPSCGGGGGGPICASVSSLSISNVVNPDCGLENGSFQIDVTFSTPQPSVIFGLKYYDRDLMDSVFFTQLNNNMFMDLAARNYRYFVTAGVDTCFLDFNLAPKTSISADIVAGSKQDVFCFGDASGSIEVENLAGSSTGDYFYSINGGSWTVLSASRIPNVGDPAGLVGGNNVIRLGDVAFDPCPARLEVLVATINPEITFDVNVTDQSTCDTSDGGIEIANVAGGSGSGYEFAFVRSANPVTNGDFGSGTTLTGINADEYNVYVRDGSGCTAVQTVIIDSPGTVEFSAFSQGQPASCINPDEGRVLLDLSNKGVLNSTYVVTITSRNGLDTLYIDDTNWDGDFGVFPPPSEPGLISGDYTAVVVSNDPTICENSFDFEVIGGPVPLSFDHEIIQTCDNVTKAYRNELLLTNIVGEGNDYLLRVIRQDQTIQSEIPFTLLAGDSRLFVGDVFLSLTDETFIIQLVENQVACGEQVSVPVQIEIPERVDPIEVTISDITPSFPEKPTGSFTIFDIEGGLAPFTAYLESNDSPDSERGPDPIEFNALENRFIRIYEDLGVGDYDLFIIDSLNCEIEVDVDIPQDTAIFIPNIFTPNNDAFNETFFVRNLPQEGAELIVSNRWGKQVFSSNNYQNNWDGDDAPDGIYFYKLDVNGEVFTGWVEILRGSGP